MAGVYNFENLEITGLGHAGFKIKSPDLTIYFDPYNLKFGEKADIILITHSHHDHKDENSIELLKKEITEILIGCENIKEGEEKEIRGVKIKAVPAYNLNKPFHPRGKGCGFVLNINGKIIYYASDTDKIPEMAELGKIDLAMLPIGGTYTMDMAEAIEAVEIIKPKVVIPMHYNTFPEIKIEIEKFEDLVGRKSKVVILE
jgi:L-ascorbate metabolism protein UlaG (beta-lactamase superfamily)